MRRARADRHDSVRNWEFLRHTPAPVPGLGGEIDPRTLLRRRSSLVIADIPTSPVVADVKTGGQTPSTVFEEPDANSLLDNFGF